MFNYLSSSFYLTIKWITFLASSWPWPKFFPEKYAHEGYTYVLDKHNTEGTLMFWRCDRRTGGCKGRIQTTIDADRTFVKMVTQHTCENTGDSGFRAEICSVKLFVSPFSGNAARVRVQTAIRPCS
jgi:hypothetical protein